MYPITRLPADFTGHYQHMAKRDGVVWERFLARARDQFVAFAYDVALGGSILDLEGVPEAELLGWQYNTALKIDAVAWQPRLVWVIEVRPEATVSALGAALTYSLVARRDAVFDVPILPVVCCETMQPDVEWTCQQLGIRVEKV